MGGLCSAASQAEPCSDPRGMNWMKRCLSFSNRNCVEVANLLGGIGVRDSKDFRGPNPPVHAGRMARISREECR